MKIPKNIYLLKCSHILTGFTELTLFHTLTNIPNKNQAKIELHHFIVQKKSHLVYFTNERMHVWQTSDQTFYLIDSRPL